MNLDREKIEQKGEITVGIIYEGKLLAELLEGLCLSLGFRILFKSQDEVNASAEQPRFLLIDVAWLQGRNRTNSDPNAFLEISATKGSNICLLWDGMHLPYSLEIGPHSLLNTRARGIDEFRQALLSVSVGCIVKDHIVGSFNPGSPFFRSMGLSPEALGMLRALASGETNRECANMLGIKLSQFLLTKRNLMNKFGIHSTPKLLVFALSRGIITLPHYDKAAIAEAENQID